MAYITWDDNEVSSSSDSENKECANFTLIASHHSDGELEVSDCELIDKPSYEELQNAFWIMGKIDEICSSTPPKFAKIYLVKSISKLVFSDRLDMENFNTIQIKCRFFAIFLLRCCTRCLVTGQEPVTMTYISCGSF